MVKMTYEDLVCHLRNKAEGRKEKISIFIHSTIDNKNVAILDNTKKTYNWAYIFYDPIHRVSPADCCPADEESIYYCSSIEEAQTIGDFLLDETSMWTTSINPEDALEVMKYGEDSEDL